MLDLCFLDEPVSSSRSRMALDMQREHGFDANSGRRRYVRNPLRVQAPRCASPSPPEAAREQGLEHLLKEFPHPFVQLFHPKVAQCAHHADSIA
jgi:hypothetical protein